jgi:ATP diphosphatase
MSAPIPKWRCAAPTPNSERRFGHIERALEAQGRSLHQASLAEMEALWNEAKRGE